MFGFGSSNTRVTVNCPICGEEFTGKGLNESLAYANANGKLAAHKDVTHSKTVEGAEENEQQ